MPNRVNYDEIAPVFDARYHGGLYDGVLEALRALVSAAESECALEVGCGTGYWLKALRPTVPNLYGVDYSLGMLRKARFGNQAASWFALPQASYRLAVQRSI